MLTSLRAQPPKVVSVNIRMFFAFIVTSKHFSSNFVSQLLLTKNKRRKLNRDVALSAIKWLSLDAGRHSIFFLFVPRVSSDKIYENVTPEKNRPATDKCSAVPASIRACFPFCSFPARVIYLLLKQRTTDKAETIDSA